MNTREAFQQIAATMNTAVIGQETVVERLLIALLADGHVLMEGLPGVAKTRSIKTLSKLVASQFSRVQFTPDLLPSDVTGSEIYRALPETGGRKWSSPWPGYCCLSRWPDRSGWPPPVSRDLPTPDLLLLVDLSGSMAQQDFTTAAGAKVDRLSAVKEVLGAFLLRRKGDRVGLVVFGDAPFLQAPFSTDLDISRHLLDETAVGMTGPRTAFGDAIGLGITLFEHSDAPVKTIIALTDGNDSASQVPPVEAARVANERGIRIYTVAMGDPTTVGENKLDETALRSVAETSGGTYFFAADRKQLAGIYDELDKIETSKVKVVSYPPQNELYYWPLLAGLLLSLAEKAVAARHRFTAQAVAARGGKVRVDPVSGRLEVQS